MPEYRSDVRVLRRPLRSWVLFSHGHGDSDSELPGTGWALALCAHLRLGVTAVPLPVAPTAVTCQTASTSLSALPRGARPPPTPPTTSTLRRLGAHLRRSEVLTGVLF